MDQSDVMASLVRPSTLAPSLSRRSWQDQGLITGLSPGATYLLARSSQDVIDVVARSVQGAAAAWAWFPDHWSDERRTSVATLACELGRAPLGLGLAAYLDVVASSRPGTDSCGRPRGGWGRRR